MLFRLSPSLVPLALGSTLLFLSTPSDSMPSDDLAVVGLELGDVALLTLDGTQVELADYVGDGPLVVAYTGVGCPISMKYAPRLQRMSESFGERGVTFVGVNSLEIRENSTSRSIVESVDALSRLSVR